VAPIVRIAALALVAFALAGCGSSHSAQPPPKGGVTNGGWEVISQGRHAAGETVVRVDALATDPLRLQLRVDASPRASITTTYTVECGQEKAKGGPVPGKTPLTRELRVPNGGGSQEAHGVFCSVSATATKPAGSATTLTLLERPAPTTQ